MALSGMHVVCGYGGGHQKSWERPFSDIPLDSFLPLTGPIKWSETLASAGTTSGVAPADNQLDGPPIFSVRCSVDAWVATGPTPNASTGARRYIAANTDYDFFAEPGHKLAWIAA